MSELCGSCGEEVEELVECSDGILLCDTCAMQHEDDLEIEDGDIEGTGDEA